MLQLRSSLVASRQAHSTRATGSWRRARRQDLAELHAWYLASSTPFAIEISGPELGMPLAAFSSWASEDAEMWVARSRGRLCAYLWFSAIQPSVGAASIDWGFAEGIDPSGAEFGPFAKALRTATERLGMRKLHLLAMPDQFQRLQLAGRLGFQEEGRLREHFFHGGKLNDLVCLGWLGQS